jgi:N-sulfoglucosamine sulfohydrolase
MTGIRCGYCVLGHGVLLNVLVAFAMTTQVDAAERPNVLLIVSEDNGPELGCYGDPYARTPNIDQLAIEGVRFENAFVPYSVCSPSRAVFLTGLYPHQNGQIGLATHNFAMYEDDTPNVVTHLKAAGYRTGLIGKLHVNPESAFPFDYRAIPIANFQRKQAVDEYAAAAAKFFAEARGKPFFLSVNFPDAHLPFLRQANGRPSNPLGADDVQPMSWVGVDSARLREEVANYYNCLERLDAGVGLLLKTLASAGLADDTIVVYFGDHGAAVRSELVSTVDLLPTILAAAAIDIPNELPGRALQPLLRDEASAAWRQYSYALTTGSFPRACFVQNSIRDYRFKLISSPRPGTENLDAGTYLDEQHQHFVVSGATAQEQAAAPQHVRQAFARWSRPPRYELYDLQVDPNEWHNLADIPEHAVTLDRLTVALRDWQRQTRDPFIEQKHVDAYVTEQLSNLDLSYRQDKAFRWSYLDHFLTWRTSQLAIER